MAQKALSNKAPAMPRFNFYHIFHTAVLFSLCEDLLNSVTTVPIRRGTAVRLAVTILCLGCLRVSWLLSDSVREALMSPPRPDPTLGLNQFRLNRNIRSYLDDIYLLIEPSRTVCSLNQSVKVEILVLVTSAPKRLEQRQAIRKTWGKHLPTYFVIGLDGPTMGAIMIEAKMYDDIILFNFKDHYQNLTLKTALMIQWTTVRCSDHLEEMMLFKTDDDVLINPWILRRAVRENSGNDLVGAKQIDSLVYRDKWSKWFLPRWERWQDLWPEFLSGTGYLINGRKLKKILNAASDVPIIHLEDVYFTYLVSKDSIAAEKFYGALLERVDAILASIGAKDAGCKERAVCALYKDPFKHSPYSNLVSNELSKDSNELVPPADSTMALRYFKYVQAARDGQESKDCITLYPSCNVDYNK